MSEDHVVLPFLGDGPVRPDDRMLEHDGSVWRGHWDYSYAMPPVSFIAWRSGRGYGDGFNLPVSMKDAPDEQIRSFIDVFNQGKASGNASGQAQKQLEIKRVLGL